MREMSARQEKFAILYALYGDGTKAAKEAGYSARSAGRQALDLLQNPRISARIKEELKKFRDKQQEILVRETASAVKTLVALMTGEKRGSMVQLGAANSILDRGGLPVIKREERSGIDGQSLPSPTTITVEFVRPSEKPVVDAEPERGKLS